MRQLRLQFNDALALLGKQEAFAIQQNNIFPVYRKFAFGIFGRSMPGR